MSQWKDLLIEIEKIEKNMEVHLEIQHQIQKL
ncbi:hypothetical protein J2S17_000529 [Cytobacillus purgationiresistens]|uniref:Uncharacterized protein n=1 Tax=Cytobacillus purgationiresistens TaxID=863449 RepID=A0ABU0ABM4_9BACI|nr:hypothetical protein [Cytobacillus purgationiresistens]